MQQNKHELKSTHQSELTDSKKKLLFIDNDTLRTFQVAEIPYQALIWLNYRLGATFAMGLPLVLLIWAAMRREASMVRLLSIYWKIASLMGISMMLLTDQRPVGYLISFLAPVLMVVSVWFWVDLNEELADLPYWRPLPFTVKLWRWALSGFGLLSTILGLLSLPCITANQPVFCSAWLEDPQNFHLITAKLFNFLFGAAWTKPLAAFIGYAILMAYMIGLLQWILIRLPKQGRIAGEF